MNTIDSLLSKCWSRLLVHLLRLITLLMLLMWLMLYRTKRDRMKQLNKILSLWYILLTWSKQVFCLFICLATSKPKSSSAQRPVCWAVEQFGLWDSLYYMLINIPCPVKFILGDRTTCFESRRSFLVSRHTPPCCCYAQAAPLRLSYLIS